MTLPNVAPPLPAAAESARAESGPIDAQQWRTLGSVPTIILWHTAADGSMVRDHPAWTQFTGQTFEQMRGFGWVDALHPDDRARIDAEWRAAVAEGRPFESSYRQTRGDGSYRIVTSQGAPVFADDGSIREWVGLCADVSHALALQHALDAREEQLGVLTRIEDATRSMNDATSIMATTARLLGEHLNATRCAYADVERDGLSFTIRADWCQPGVPTSAGTYRLDLFGPQAVANLHRGVALVVGDVDAELGEAGGAPMFRAIGVQAIVCAGLVKEGRLVAMMAVHQATPRRWTAAECAVIDHVVDRCWAHIERVRDNAALREQDRRKDEFLATLAHELRNPLAPMRYALSILQKSTDPAHRARATQALERQTAHMVRLVDDLLDISRISRGVIELRHSRVALRGLVEHAVEIARPPIEAARHTLAVALPPEDLWLDVDPARIVQVISNLLTNAAKYTPAGGRIDIVAAGRADGWVTIDVVDNGIGIDLPDQQRVFELFTQVSPSGRRAEGGLGIGLALARSLAEAHDGRLDVTSAGLGQGSRFTLRLPRAQAPTPAP